MRPVLCIGCSPVGGCKCLWSMNSPPLPICSGFTDATLRGTSFFTGSVPVTMASNLSSVFFFSCHALSLPIKSSGFLHRHRILVWKLRVNTWAENFVDSILDAQIEQQNQHKWFAFPSNPLIYDWMKFIFSLVKHSHYNRQGIISVLSDDYLLFKIVKCFTSEEVISNHTQSNFHKIYEVPVHLYAYWLLDNPQFSCISNYRIWHMPLMYCTYLLRPKWHEKSKKKIEKKTNPVFLPFIAQLQFRINDIILN